MAKKLGRNFKGSPNKTSTSKGNTLEGNNKTWKLANKQTRPNNQTSEIISEIHEFNRI
jgi:hypothetical protein